MKALFSVILVLGTYICSAQNSANAIVGKWLKTPKEDMIIEVYKAGNEYQGKIAWTSTTDQKKAAGFVILDKLIYNADSNTWEDGRIHDPRSGKNYAASVKLKPDGMLEVHAYMGFKFIGKKKYFKKTT